jgi:hypothetical protein
LESKKVNESKSSKKTLEKVLETDSPRHHRLAIPNHHPLRIGTLNAILRAVAEIKGLEKDDILNPR